MAMKTERAIELAGNAKALAELLEITPSAISQWGDEVPQPRVWQLMVLRPAWFQIAQNQQAAKAN
jgi:predicted transcriptional regulator